MLYLEDFLELIDPLPEELKNRFTELRTLDLQVQNALDRHEENVKNAFTRAPNISESDRTAEYSNIQNQYKKILNDSDEKVKIATSMHDLVEKYQRKLHEQVTKFKLELEADNPGLTETIEDRVRRSEQTLREIRKQQRKKKARTESGCFIDVHSPIQHDLPTPYDDEEDSVMAIVEKYSKQIKGEHVPRRHPPSTSRTSTSTAEQNATLIDILKNATASLGEGSRMSTDKSPFTSPTSGDMPLSSTIHHHAGSSHTPTSLMPPPSYLAAGSGLSSLVSTQESRHGRPRKPSHRVQEMLESSMKMPPSFGLSSRTSTSGPHFSLGGPSNNDSDSEDDEAGADQDQRRWCICNKTSYGNMVACDNPVCPFEWFHYPCVGINAPPKGKWYCPHCTAAMKRRAN